MRSRRRGNAVDLLEDGGVWQSWTEERNVIPRRDRHLKSHRHATAQFKLGGIVKKKKRNLFNSCEKTNLVGDVVRARVLHLHHHVGVQEVGLDHVGHKGSVLLLEHNGDDVVAYVSLPLQLGVKQINRSGSNNKAGYQEAQLCYRISKMLISQRGRQHKSQISAEDLTNCALHTPHQK